jgi:hypothetical protein
MDAQLRLMAEAHSAEPLEAPISWRIDDTTKAVGRSGLAMARDALRRARRADTTTADTATGDAPVRSTHQSPLAA